MPKRKVLFSAFFIISGGLLAAYTDLAFDIYAYALVFANDLATSSNYVLIKSKLSDPEIDKISLTFYNFLLAIVPITSYCFLAEDITQSTTFSEWQNPTFIFLYLLSAPSAYLLYFSSAWCIEKNGPISVSIVGVAKVGNFNFFKFFFNYLNLEYNRDNLWNRHGW